MSAEKERKKHLIREYKKTPKTMGAYCIRNRDTQRAFVGISRDVDARLNRHRFMLKSGSEDFADLQQDYNLLGVDAFEFTLLEVLEPPTEQPGYNPTEDLDVLKALWCTELNAYLPEGYTPTPRD